MFADFSDAETMAIESAAKLQGISHLLYNYKHELSSDEDRSAWVGISLILQEVAASNREIAEALDRARRTSVASA